MNPMKPLLPIILIVGIVLVAGCVGQTQIGTLQDGTKVNMQCYNDVSKMVDEANVCTQEALRIKGYTDGLNCDSEMNSKGFDNAPLACKTGTRYIDEEDIRDKCIYDVNKKYSDDRDMWACAIADNNNEMSLPNGQKINVPCMQQWHKMYAEARDCWIVGGNATTCWDAVRLKYNDYRNEQDCTTNCNWQCSGWGACISGTQVRTCSGASFCNADSVTRTLYHAPEDSRAC